MRNSLLLSLLGCCLLGTSAGASAQQPIVDRDGNGLIDINNLDDLAAMRNDLAGRTLRGSSNGCPTSGCFGYELTRDLDFDTNGNGKVDQNDWNGGNGWFPVGAYAPFTATFNGNGHAIRNLKLLRFSYLSSQGLFGTIQDAHIVNLRLERVRLSMSTEEGDRQYLIGALAGRALSSSILLVYVDSVDFHANLPGSFIGGIVGYAHTSDFNEVRYSGDIAHPLMHLNSTLGGIAGLTVNSSLSNAIAKGSILGPRVGGLVGFMTNSNISRSFSNSHLRARNAGGLVLTASYREIQRPGVDDKYVDPAYFGISASYALGSIVLVDEGSMNAGGLVSSINLHDGAKARVTNSYSRNVIHRPADNLSWTNLIQNAAPDVSIQNSYWVTNPEGVHLPNLFGNVTEGGYSLQDLQCAAPDKNNGCSYPSLFNTWGTGWDYGTTAQLPALRTFTLYPWISSDTPNATGDHESFSNLRKAAADKMCDNPIWLAAKVKKTAYRFSAPQHYDHPLATFNPREGLVCLNQDQSNSGCQDFQVRYLCDETSVGGSVRWTDWINNSRPDGVGDDERLRTSVCMGGITPVGIDAKSPANIRLGPPQKLSRFSLTRGLTCLNADNPGGCKDYELQFQCPTLGDR